MNPGDSRPPSDEDSFDDADDRPRGDDRPRDDDSCEDGDDRREPGVRAEDDGPAPVPGTSAAGREEDFLTRFRTARDGPLMVVREILYSAGIVLLIGLILFAVSGVWPPMVAVKSGSMDPNMQRGDLVLVTEPGRFAPDGTANGTGVVTYETGQESEYTSFNDYGSVVVFHDPASRGDPIIHRAHFYVEEDENWYDQANPDYMKDGTDDCASLSNCPAPHDGFITKGDNNAYYDQANGIAPVVREEWVSGVARVRIPYLGYVRLCFTGEATCFSGTAGTPTGSTVPPGAGEDLDGERSDPFDAFVPAAVAGGAFAAARRYA